VRKRRKNKWSKNAVTYTGYWYRYRSMQVCCLVAISVMRSYALCRAQSCVQSRGAWRGAWSCRGELSTSPPEAENTDTDTETDYHNTAALCTILAIGHRRPHRLPSPTIAHPPPRAHHSHRPQNHLHAPRPPHCLPGLPLTPTLLLPLLLLVTSFRRPSGPTSPAHPHPPSLLSLSAVPEAEKLHFK
jgi:hypothetical protein